MTEVLPTQNDQQRNPRPIGRFLLGFEQYAETKDPFAYAAEFAHLPGNFEKYKHTSLKIESAGDEAIDDRGVQLEFMIDRYSYVWKIIVAAERHKTEDIGRNYVTHGGEQYELHCSVSKNIGYYREYTSQGMIMRERQIESGDELQTLQGLIEQLVDRE